MLQVLLEFKVDPSLLSGICVNSGDKYIDLSAGTPLSSLTSPRASPSSPRSQPHLAPETCVGAARLKALTLRRVRIAFNKFYTRMHDRAGVILLP